MISKVAFDSVCEMVAKNYINKGWRYAKSNHWMTKKDKKFTYKIYFYTNWHNISDVDVTFYGSGQIISTKSKKLIYYTTTGDSNVPPTVLQWNVAKKEDWDNACMEFITWLERDYIPLVNRCSENLEQFVVDVVREGFCPKRGYITDIDFILSNGNRELAEKSAQYYYDNLDEKEKIKFKNNYKSLIENNIPYDAYGKNSMLNCSNFKAIIENKLNINL